MKKIEEMNADQLLELATTQATQIAELEGKISAFEETEKALEKANSDLTAKVAEQEASIDKLNEVIAGAGATLDAKQAVNKVSVAGKEYVVEQKRFRLPKDGSVYDVATASEETLNKLLAVKGQTVLREAE